MFNTVEQDDYINKKYADSEYSHFYLSLYF